MPPLLLAYAGGDIAAVAGKTPLQTCKDAVVADFQRFHYCPAITAVPDLPPLLLHCGALICVGFFYFLFLQNYYSIFFFFEITRKCLSVVSLFILFSFLTNITWLFVLLNWLRFL